MAKGLLFQTPTVDFSFSSAFDKMRDVLSVDTTFDESVNFWLMTSIGDFISAYPVVLFSLRNLIDLFPMKIQR